MAILDAALKADIRAKIDAVFGAIPPSLSAPQQSAINARRDDLATIIAECGIYVRDNCVITSNVLVASVSGVATGPGTSGPGTGTATGTMS